MPGLLSQQPGQQQSSFNPQGGVPGDKQPTRVRGGAPTAEPDPEVDDEEGGNVAPEEQEQYDTFVTNGMKLMHGAKGEKALINAIEGDDNPVEGLANAVVMIVTRVQDSAEKAGIQLSDDVVMHGGTELLEQAADFSEQTGGHAFTEKEIEDALYIAMDLYGTTRQSKGKLDQGRASADMEELNAAEQSGQLEEMAPGIGEYVSSRSGAAEQDEEEPEDG